ncbi:hypothetical protein RND81_04G116300 [Saponaria officinalis]|uniref:Ribonucleotide reductase large subunit domain-containing protein n=1 Tax=Saponaria officinalis TaxID=3572 RepID=A0AAW1LM09_SAPOF
MSTTTPLKLHVQTRDIVQLVLVSMAWQILSFYSGLPFDSPEAHQLNKVIFETIYYHALKMSCELAKRDDPYDTYEGSPILSRGILQPDMWGVVPSNRWYWDALRKMIARNGVRNTVVLAPVPSSLTS